MSPQLIRKNLEYIKVLPAWAQELSYKYLSKTTNLYILHGNVRDFLPHRLIEDEFVFTRIQEYVSDVLFANRDIIVYFDRSSGINFNDISMRQDYFDAMTQAFPEADSTAFFSSDPLTAFHYLEKYFLLNLPKKLRIVLIIDYAETLLPAAEMTQMTEEDRTCYVTLNRWAHDPIFTQGDVSIFLITENMTELNQKLSASPLTVKVSLPIPDAEVREKFLQFLERQDKLLLESRLSSTLVAQMTGGLNLMNLHQIASESFQEGEPISLDYLKRKKKEILENEAGGLLEFLEGSYNLDYVSGHEFVKRRLQSATKAIKQGRLDVLPMGYLIAGPVGTGKTFLVSAFAAELGIPIVRLQNLKSRWQGVTESNLEKVLGIFQAMAPVGVLIDEADVLLKDPRSHTEHSDTTSRIFSQLANFMGNTENRGRILWFLVTSRPDLIPIDLKRQGRAEEHLALFYPESPEEKEALFHTLVKKLDLKIRDFSISDLLKKFRQEFSGADLEAILIRAKFSAALAGRTFITKDDLEETIKDFIPPVYPHEIELQNLVAALECTSREMIPKRFQNLDRAKLIQEIQELKLLLGER